MQTRTFALTAAAVLLHTVPFALGHGDDHMADMGGMEQDSLPMTYFSYSEHSGLLWTYVALTVITWLVVAPPGAKLDCTYQLIAP